MPEKPKRRGGGGGGLVYDQNFYRRAGLREVTVKDA